MTNSGFTELDQCYGSASVVGATGASVTPGFRTGRIVDTVRNSAGLYTLTMSPGLRNDECVINCEINEPNVRGRSIIWQQTSNTTIQVMTSDPANAALDLNFKCIVRKVRQVNQ